MPNVVDLTPATLRRIIQEERQKLMLEAKVKKTKGMSAPELKKHSNTPPEPKVGGKGKKSTVSKQVETAKAKAKKAMSLDEAEVEADEMAETIAKKVQHLKEMRDMEQRLRSQLRLVLERKNGIEQDIADLL
jgi:hypothetical protein